MIFYRGEKTESAGTPITHVVPGRANAIARIHRFCYTAGATAHTVEIMRPIGTMQTTVNTDSTSTILNVNTVQPGSSEAYPPVEETLASQDWLIWEDVAGVWRAGKVSSAATTTVTLTAAVGGADIPAGRTIYACYEPTRGIHDQHTVAVSTRLEVECHYGQAGFSVQRGIGKSRAGIGDPLLFYSPNTTNAGTLDFIAGYWENPTTGITAG